MWFPPAARERAFIEFFGPIRSWVISVRTVRVTGARSMTSILHGFEQTKLHGS